MAQEVTRDVNGRLLPGSVLNPGGNPATKGRARITERTLHILQKPVSEINYALTRGHFESLSGAEAAAYRRAHATIYGDINDVEFVTDRDEGPVAKQTQLTGPRGGPIAVVTADVSSLLLDLSQRSENQ